MQLKTATFLKRHVIIGFMQRQRLWDPMQKPLISLQFAIEPIYLKCLPLSIFSNMWYNASVTFKNHKENKQFWK